MQLFSQFYLFWQAVLFTFLLSFWRLMNAMFFIALPMDRPACTLQAGFSGPFRKPLFSCAEEKLDHLKWILVSAKYLLFYHGPMGLIVMKQRHSESCRQRLR